MIEAVRVTVEEIRLQRFRAFENARLVLSDLTFLVGRNGAGKSSILDAVDLLREAVSDSLENTLDRRGGLQKVQRSKSGPGRKTPMGIAVVFRISFPGNRQTRAVYGFEIQDKPSGDSSNIRECFLSSKETNFKRENEISAPAMSRVFQSEPFISTSGTIAFMRRTGVNSLKNAM